MSVRFLVLDGNTRSVRESYAADTGRTPAQGYGEVLKRILPESQYDILTPADADCALPTGVALGDYNGVVITGSSLHVWEGLPETLRQIELARAVYAAGVPFFGSCWGLQVAAVAAGGVVRKNPRGRELAFARGVYKTAAGERHPLLAGRPRVFDAPCIHLDEVETLPPESTLLASNAVSAVQAAEFRFAGGRFWGVQYHPEYSLSHLGYLIGKRAPILTEEGFFADHTARKVYADDLAKLDGTGDTPSGDASYTALAWRYGLDIEVLEEARRVCEIRNFVTNFVLARH